VPPTFFIDHALRFFGSVRRVLGKLARLSDRAFLPLTCSPLFG
jgi:hypothetical protein